jgi:hypothetical protein
MGWNHSFNSGPISAKERGGLRIVTRSFDDNAERHRWQFAGRFRRNAFGWRLAGYTAELAGLTTVQRLASLPSNSHEFGA